ncbi:MAG TPA: DUF6496 domain-containing protein [Parafilimonas sp.]|jgi:hypothetical protein|nr:DUF6496 domain-containing protein [Parafilimonas sp.]
MAKYGKKSQQKVKKSMDEMKKGKLKSGRSGKKVTNRKQAIAIGLSEARKSGGKVPKKSSTKKSAKKSSPKKSAKKSSTKKSAKKSSSKKSAKKSSKKSSKKS